MFYITFLLNQKIFSQNELTQIILNYSIFYSYYFFHFPFMNNTNLLIFKTFFVFCFLKMKNTFFFDLQKHF